MARKTSQQPALREDDSDVHRSATRAPTSDGAVTQHVRYLQQSAGNRAVVEAVHQQAGSIQVVPVQRMKVTPETKNRVLQLKARYLQVHADDYAGWETLVGQAKNLSDLEARVDVINPPAAAFTPTLKDDGHGTKHTEFSHSPVKTIIAKSKAKPPIATFLPAFADAYQQYLFRVIRSAYAVNPPTNFIDMGANCGYDAGDITDCVELYYNDDIGSHMRPKKRSLITAPIARLLQ